MRGLTRQLELIGFALLVVVLAVVGSRVSAEGNVAGGGSTGAGSNDVVGLVDRLRMAGLTVTIEGAAHENELSVTGQSLVVDGETVEVFAYADIWAAEADAAKLVADENSAVTQISDWIDAPRLFRNDRLLVLHIGGSARLNAVLSSVLNSSASPQGVH